MADLSGKVAIITGAGRLRGIGRAAAVALAQDGADIVTMPPAVFEGMYKHILTDKGLDLFDKDYAASVKE